MKDITWKEIYTYGESPAIQTEDSILTYNQLANICNKMKASVEGRNLIFHLCSNTPDAIAAYVAFYNEGQVQLLLDENLKKEKIDLLISLYHPRYLSMNVAKKCEYPNFKVIVYIGEYVLLETDCGFYCKPGDDLALLLTTSGSTGSRKYVRLSYKNVRSNAEAIAEYLELGREDKPMMILPMYYAYGLSIINSHILVGATLLVTDKKIIQKEFWDFFTKYKATSVSGIPYVYEILDRMGFFGMRFPDLNKMTQAGGRLSETLHKKLAKYAEDIGGRFYAMYGQTEATARIAYLPYRSASLKCGSIGHAIPGGRLELADNNGRKIDNVGIEGEIIYYGPNVSQGYAEGYEDLNKGDEWKGKLCTGDMGKRDEDGFYYITGRKKRIIKLFGKRISLDEIELLIKDKFLGTDCCCGGSDDELIVITDEKDEEKRIMIKIFLASELKIPLVFVNVKYRQSLPRTETGKIMYDMILGNEK